MGEALRALQTGALVLAAVYLRDADAKGALSAIEKAQAQDLAPDGLIDALKGAASRPSAESWLAVLRAIRPHRDAQGEESGDDEEIVRSAAFATAIEAYRSTRPRLNPARRSRWRSANTGWPTPARSS